MLAAIIAVVMVSSAFGIIFGGFSEPETKFDYNGFKFSTAANGYKTKVAGTTVLFSFAPQQAALVNLSLDAVASVKAAKMAYLSYDPDSRVKDGIAQAQFYLSQDLKSLLGTYAISAMTAPNAFSLPVVGCANATQFVPVIVFEESNDTLTSYSNGCLKLMAPSTNEFILLKDRLVYGALGIIG